MRRLLLSATFLLICLSSFSQERNKVRKVWDKLFNDTTVSAKPKFIAYPLLAYTPETSWEIGVSGLVVYNAKKNLKNRLSEISALTFLTLENQYGFWLDHALYTNKNDFFFLGKFRVQQFPLLYYGVGVDTPSDPVARIDGFAITWRERLLKKLKEDFYMGLELDLNHLSNVQILEENEGFVPPPGVEGFTNFGVGVGLVYDQRYNVLNPRRGLFVEGGFLRYDRALGSDYSFHSYFLDFRYYQPTFKDQILAFQFVFNSVEGFNESEVPFNQLSLMGGENLMRGYYLGRYRDNTLVAGQAEYRFLPFPFSKRFGGVAFGSVGAVSPSVANLNMKQIRAAGGLGLRFLLFPGKDIYTRFDVAFTNEGIGYYLYIGEAF